MPEDITIKALKEAVREFEEKNALFKTPPFPGSIHVLDVCECGSELEFGHGDPVGICRKCKKITKSELTDNQIGHCRVDNEPKA